MVVLAIDSFSAVRAGVVAFAFFGYRDRCDGSAGIVAAGAEGVETHTKCSRLRGVSSSSGNGSRGDSRSHGGDGLGPVYNDSSCVACHNLGGSGGGGAASKNVDIITASPNGGVMVQSPPGAAPAEQSF